MKATRAVRRKIESDSVETRYLHGQFDRAQVDEEKRTVPLAFSSEQPVEYWFGNEILLHDAGCCDLGRVNQGLAPILFNHGRDSQYGMMPVGKILSATIDTTDHKGRAVVQFDDDEQSDRVFQKVLSGTLQGVSVGYRWVTNSYEVVDEGDTSADGRFEGPAVIVRRWEVLEISIASVAADVTVGIGRNLDAEGMPIRAAMKDDQPEGGEERTMDREEELKRANEEALAAKAREIEKAKGEAAEAERVRTQEILAIGDSHALSDMARAAIEKNVTVDAFRTQVLQKIAEDRKALETAGVRIVVDEADKFRSAAIDSVVSKVSVLASRLPQDYKWAPGYDELRSMSLRELARECLVRKGERVSFGIMDMVGRALTTSDLPVILGAVANKSLQAGWELADETWRQVFGTGSVNNFHIHTAARAGEMPDLEEIPEGGEYKTGERSETFETYQVATYGKKFSITRQAIINDDLGAMTDIPAGHGEAANRKVGDVAWYQITSNPAMGDGVTLFHATSHANYTASGAAPSTSTLDVAVAAMMKQKDIGGLRRLNIKPVFFAAPVSIMGTSRTFFATLLIGGVANQPNLSNIYAGDYFKQVYESRLDDNSLKAWYLFGPKGKTVKVFFLEGSENPYMEQQRGWDVDGVEYKVRIDVGAKAMDYRGLYKNKGEA